MNAVSLENHPHATCCDNIPHLHLKTSTKDKIWQIVEKVSLLAIGVFAAITLPKIFAITFCASIILGLIDKSIEKTDHKHQATCSHSFLEQLTGVRLPAPLGFASNVAVLLAHMEHHAPVFVPLVGMTLGLWVGKSIIPKTAETVSLYCRNIVAFAGLKT